jgi:predicted TIM-barrel fold metal-dependent hydrolase
VHEVTEAASACHAVALKTILAYTTGLAVRPVSYVAAREAYHACLVGDMTREKEVRDYLFVITAEIAARLNLPLQVHTGFTALKRPWSQANPLLLQEVLAQKATRDTTFVLLHGGYPFTAEAGYLASAFPNVYVDLSLMIPFTGLGAERRLAEIMEFAPFERIVYGSDGSAVPETFWLGARTIKAALGTLLGRLVDQRILGPETAYSVANLVLWRNAAALYGLANLDSGLRNHRAGVRAAPGI